MYNVEKISPKKYLVDITASDLLMKFFVNWIWQHLRTIVKVTETDSALGNKPSVLIKLKPLLLCRKFILKPSRVLVIVSVICCLSQPLESGMPTLGHDH